MPRFLQLVHISDSHFSGKSLAHRMSARRTLGMASQGLAGHSPSAFRAFGKALRTIVADPDWTPHPTVLLHTGDHTTWGDEVVNGLTFARQWAATSGATLVTLPGNHDAWTLGPGPQVRTWSPQQDVLLSQEFGPGPWLQKPIPLPSGVGSLKLIGLDTVPKSAATNALAAGVVSGNDMSLARRSLAADPGRHLAVFVMHHPVDDPKGVSMPHRRVTNGDEFADFVSDLQKTGAIAASLVLGGHTHLLHPPLGRFSKVARTAAAPRKSDALVGSLAQVRTAAFLPQALRTRPQEWHQFQVLRFSEDDDVPGKVYVERLVLARALNTGDFAYLPGPDGTVDEYTTFTV
jgi:3',5'-cyclic AMP phosphodiesterase CpdA